MKRLLVPILTLALLSGCTLGPPTEPDNICRIFDQKWGWKSDARRAEQRWGSPVPVMMAIMYQESAFQSRARPRRVRFLGIPLWWRLSDAYGYAQAKDDTWRWYETSVGRSGRRTNFGDAIDFIGWYNNMSQRQLGLSPNDPYSLYLAYHEGHGGYRSGTYRGKDWLLQAASRVRDRSNMYSAQWQRCR